MDSVSSGSSLENAFSEKMARSEVVVGAVDVVVFVVEVVAVVVLVVLAVGVVIVDI